jgi:hypothetical protein
MLPFRVSPNLFCRHTNSLASGPRIALSEAKCREKKKEKKEKKREEKSFANKQEKLSTSNKSHQ